MSEVERNKGRLIPTGIDTEHFTDDDWDNIYDNGFICVNGEVYKVEYEVKRDTNDYHFAEATENDDGTISFHTMHYNGGAGLEEVIEEALNAKS